MLKSEKQNTVGYSLVQHCLQLGNDDKKKEQKDYEEKCRYFPHPKSVNLLHIYPLDQQRIHPKDTLTQCTRNSINTILNQQIKLQHHFSFPQ